MRKPGRSPRPPTAAANESAAQAEPALIEYDDGGVYTEEGAEIVAPFTPNGPGETPTVHSDMASSVCQPSEPELPPPEVPTGTV